MAEQTTDLVYAPNLENYPALKADNRVIDLVRDAMGSETLNIFKDLDRVSVPSGGGTSWEIPDMDAADGTRSDKIITGIVIRDQYLRSYYDQPYGKGESGPPQCSSWEFGGQGTGEPGGDCQTCPLNEYGSGISQDGSASAGKACAEKRFIFLATTNSALPMVVQASATSLAAIRLFKLRLAADKNKGFSEVVVDLSLKKETKGGFPTAIIVPRINCYLSDDEIQRVQTLSEQMEPLLRRVAQDISSEAFLNDE